MYREDSFHTLTLEGQAGLLILSMVLGGLLIWAARRTTRRRFLAIRLGGAVLVFWAFLWLSPQIYYLYYMILIDGLPLQNVIKSPPGVTEMASLLTFTDCATLSNRGKGVLGWAMMVCNFYRGRT